MPPRPLSPAIFIGVIVVLVIALGIVTFAVIRPSDPEAQPPPTGPVVPGERPEEGPPRAGEQDPLRSPRDTLGRQLALIEAHDVGGLRETFTPRVRDDIDDEVVRAVRPQLEGTTVGDLLGRVEPVEGERPPRMRIITPADVELTTMVLHDGRWLADSIWFR